ncbi:12687_t:CDS:2 [Cetraspora pellucida]|uniref:12687_t:CDS:1 n=1 Tax=Cetraspora pellucida TaxID=1433469 RepID=A0A9N9CZI9_9GLOM|nr:12687_t:CDS:2 [Cetraspora pellucida]
MVGLFCEHFFGFTKFTNEMPKKQEESLQERSPKKNIERQEKNKKKVYKKGLQKKNAERQEKSLQVFQKYRKTEEKSTN